MPGAGGFVFEDVVVERAGVRALDGLSAQVPGHGVTAVTGPSGAGKSTLLRLCNRLEVPARGRVLFDGADVAGLDPLQLRRRVGMVFQRPTPFPGSVTDNLLTARPGATPDELRDVLDRVGLGQDYADRDAGALSGGESQRVCLARTLITAPEILLLDEPTSALDEEAGRAVEATVLALVAHGLAALWVSHDPGQVDRVADRVLRVERGRCVGMTEVRDGGAAAEEAR